MASIPDDTIANALNYDNDRLNSRDALVTTLQKQVEEMVEKLIMLTVYKELPSSTQGAGNDQTLVDGLAQTLSQLLQHCIVGEERIGAVLAKTEFSKSTSKDSDALALSLMMLSKPLDERAIYWIRYLINQKTLHKCVEALLIYASTHGRSHQEPIPVDPTFDSIEAGLLLNHKGDIISTLKQVKTAPLKFSIDAPLPSQ